MSTHKCPVIRIEEFHPHPNADSLSIVKVGGWQVCVQTAAWKLGDLATYIEPDMVVPTDRPEFAFLAREGETTARIKAKKLRGQMSYGLLVPAYTGGQRCKAVEVGDDQMAELGITRYEPPVSTSDDSLPYEEWPKVALPTSKFDVESWNNYPDTIKMGEEVVVTEKIHGANGKFVYKDGKFYCGSRTRWLKEGSLWHRALENTPGLQATLNDHPGYTIYGEVYGPVQSLRYGCDKPQFAAFAAVDAINGNWLSHNWLEEFNKVCGLPLAPVLYRGPMSETVFQLAETDSLVSKVPQLMEGVVIKPVTERWDENIGRVVLKHISNRYWAKE